MFEDDDQSLSREQKQYFASIARSKKIIKLIRVLNLIVVLPLVILSYYNFIFITIAFFIFVVLFIIRLIHKDNIK